MDRSHHLISVLQEQRGQGLVLCRLKQGDDRFHLPTLQSEFKASLGNRVRPYLKMYSQKLAKAISPTVLHPRISQPTREEERLSDWWWHLVSHPVYVLNITKLWQQNKMFYVVWILPWHHFKSKKYHLESVAINVFIERVTWAQLAIAQTGQFSFLFWTASEASYGLSFLHYLLDIS